MQVEINITATVTTAQYGTLVSGDILRTSKEFAAHLVDDCRAAQYAKVEQQEPEKRTRKTKDTQ